MSRFRFSVLPRLLLALSILALLAGLWVLWLSLDRPMPTVALACRQAGPPNCFTGGELLASGPVRLEEGYSEQDAWALLKQGERYALAELERRAGLLWTVKELRLIDPAALGSPTLFPISTAVSNLWDPGEFWRDDYNIEDADTRGVALPLAVCTDPAAVRLEGEFLVVGRWEDPQDAWEERAVPITWTYVGSGVWAGEPVSSPMPRSPDDPGRSGGAFSIWCRAYDAGGNLIASYEPTAE